MNQVSSPFREQTMKCDDGYPLVSSYFPASRAKGIVIIASAVAVPQSFYYKLASYFSEQGYSAITFDYRGTGASLAKSKAFAVQLKDWGEKDLERVIQHALELGTDDGLPVYLLGHSIGGQLVGLAPSSDKLSGIIQIASSAPYWRRWPTPANLRMLLVSRAMIPMLSAFREQFPSQRVGLGNMQVPSAVTRDWARWMQQPDYLFDPRFEHDLSGYTRLRQALLALGFDDDTLAPEANIRHLLSFFPNSDSELRMIQADSIGAGPIGHVGFFHRRFRDSLWTEVLDWLNVHSK